MEFYHDSFHQGLVSVICLTLITVGFVMLRRTRRGEKAFTDKDWRVLFGKPKAGMLTAHYGGKLAILFVTCALVGLLEYLILMPFRATWYVVGVVVTAVVIVVLTPKALH